METYTCKTTLKSSYCLKNELEESTVIYNDIEVNDHSMYTIYCNRATATQLKNKGFNLQEN